MKSLSQEQYESKPLIPNADLFLIKQTSKHSTPEKVTVKVPDLLLHRLLPFEQNDSIEEKKQVQIITDQPQQPVAQVEDDYELPFPFCEKKHKDCGHACKGVTKERKCLPCLNSACAEKASLFGGTNEDELCKICYT